MLDKLKQYKDYIMEALLLLLTGAFLFEKSKANTDNAIIAEQKTQEEVAALQKSVDVNDSKLSEEADKRIEIQKAATDAKTDDGTDPSDFINKH